MAKRRPQSISVWDLQAPGNGSCWWMLIRRAAYGGMTSDGDLGIVPLVLRNISPRRPLLVCSAETPVPGKLLQSGGQYPPFRALVAIFLKYRFKAVLLQMHPIEVLTDRLLDGIPAGNIGVVTLAPHGKLISFLGLLCRVGIEILVILTHHPYPR